VVCRGSVREIEYIIGGTADSAASSHMNVRVEHIVVPTPLRWLGAAAVCAAAITAFVRLRDRAREPRVQPMSDDWLRSHTADRDYHQ
jgi:hypothetical protein